ncbi:MAG: AAA family ATPase, partial [Acidimicrobiales bacterium]
MFLKSLTMKGFKSFAEPTTLEFEPGVTVVVGPNGSGKSNVVDAVAWVLGAQGPRALRSAKMDDVIFAGTGKRAALGRAEVSLTIDNASGLLPVELSEVTLTRTLFRSGESEYAINQAPCRLLDIQELLSDSGVGRQQHVIVSQGQLDAVLNARPEDRRFLIEEAAGVLKYRRRREKAERRLEATEGNLVRLGDLLREVRRSIRPLERQADAVRRHDGLAQELHALRLHLAGRELVSLTRQRQASADVRASLTLQSGELSRALAELDSQVAGLEGEISESNHDGAALNLGRLQGLIERGRGLGGVLTERRRSLLAVMQSLVDEGLIPALEAELSKLDVELQAVEVEARALMGRSDELARAEAAVALDQEAFRSRFEGPDLVSGADPSQAGSPGRSAAMAVTSPAQGQAAAQAAAQARSNIESLRHSLERDLEGVERLAARQAELVARQAQIQAEAVAATDEAVRVEEEGAAITQRSQASSQALARAIEIVHMGEAEFSAADGEAHRWEARTEALALALDQVRARAGAERLADVTDVVGTLADLVKVDAGWEAAFEAAVGEAALAVVVGGAQEARASLGHLASTGESGSVLALALGPTHPERRPAAAAVRGGRAVRDHVSSPHPGVGQLLDRLLDRAVVVDGSWPEAIDIHLRHPEMVVVTRGGDRVSTWSWRIGTAGPGATGAALEEAKAAGVVAGQRRQAARVALDQARSELVACQEAVSNMTRAKLQNEARAQANKVGIQRHRADAEAIRDQMGKLLVERGELAERMGRDQAKLDQLCGLLP